MPLSLFSLSFLWWEFCVIAGRDAGGGGQAVTLPPHFLGYRPILSRLSSSKPASPTDVSSVSLLPCAAARCTRPLSTELPPPQYPLSRHVNSFQYTSSFCKTCTVGLHASYVASVSVLTLWLSDSLSQCVAGCVLTAHNAHFWNKRIIILKKTTYSSRWNCFYLSLNLSPFVPFFFPPGIGYHLFKLAPLYIRSRHVVCNPWRAPYVCNI